jgi:threonine synthase
VPIRHLVLATNENDVLDEFFRTGTYRVRVGAETHETSSPSMDISKASNVERFVYEVVGRDGERTRSLFHDELAAHGEFTLRPEEFARVARYGFVSGSSTHADRVATIRETAERCGQVVDPHTADGLKVAREHLEPGIPMIVLETALPAKFSATIVEAMGREPDRPASTRGIEELPTRFTVLPNDASVVKEYIVRHG